MTASPCIPPEELERVAALPPGDPLRRHVAACPRCSALLDAYAAFAAPGEAARAPHVAAAEARLDAFLARELGTGAPAPAPAPSWLARLLAPALRPAFAAAAALVVVGAIALWPRSPGRPTEALRGAPAAALAVETATLDASGLSVEWNALAGADDYEVRIYAADLSEVARLDANGDTVLTVSPSALSFRAVPGQPLLVRVFARAGGAPRGESAPAPIELR